MNTVLLWGMSELYNKYRNLFCMEELKQNIRIAGVMFMSDFPYSMVDGYPL